MTKLNAICVYCGSSAGTDPAMLHAARTLGRAMAEAGIELVYGGGDHGLMGAVARAVLDGGGLVTGIIPDFLRDKERMLSEPERTDRLRMIVVPDMHTRKRLMFERSDAFVALPGGIGTLEEVVEQMTWVQLDRHAKPVVIADIAGFWGPLLSLIDHMRRQGFIRADADVRHRVVGRAEDLIPAIRAALLEAERAGATKMEVDPRL